MEHEIPAGPDHRGAPGDRRAADRDVRRRGGAGRAPEAEAPSEEELVEEEIAEPAARAGRPARRAVDEARPRPRGRDEEADDFFDEKRLSDELDQALEAPSRGRGRGARGRRGSAGEPRPPEPRRGRARGDARLPRGDPRGRPALVRAEAPQGLRLRRLSAPAALRFPALHFQARGHSSAGRAPPLQGGGRRFEPGWLHTNPPALGLPPSFRPERSACGRRQLRQVLVGVVAAADQRAGGDRLEAQRRRPRAPAPRTPPGASSASTGRWFSVGRRYWPTVSTWTRCSRRMPKASTISSKDSPRPTISPDLVTTPAPPISFAIRSTRAERRNLEPRRAFG